MHTLDEARLRMIESAMGEIVVDENPENEARHMVVTEIMSLRGVCLDLPAKTKTSLLKELVNLADGTGLLFDKDGLLTAIEDREALCSTAIHAGLAVPHPRRCMPYATAEPLVCLGRVNGGIGFCAPDGELTRLFFLICCHEESHHLHVLARLMRILDEDTIAKLMKIESPEMALELLIEREASLAGS